MTLEEMKKMGYCITSRKYRTASRIDREDWREVAGNDSADLYRRCYSKDHITVPSSFLGKLKNSYCGYLEYRK